MQSPREPFTLPELKNVYIYLITIGYAVKYYLNESSILTPYDEYINANFPHFFKKVFNVWAEKYSKSLQISPRKINSFYLSIMAQ